MLNEGRKKQLNKLLHKIGLKVSDYTEVNSSLIHPSYVFEKGPNIGEHNQRLEFLGDAVVGLIIGEYLYRRFPERKEGELTKMRAAIVCEASLASAARNLGLGNFLLMGKGERLGGGAERASNLADAWEALVGALYLELGIEAIEEFIIEYLNPVIEEVSKGNYGDYKTRLQEYVQKQPDSEIEYRILKEVGPDHEKQFFAGVFINGQLIAEGEGRTKKEAEQKGAQKALKDFGEI